MVKLIKTVGENLMNDIIPGLIMLLPLLILAFVLRWVRLIKINSEYQVEQNKQIISLLQKIERKIDSL